MDKYLLQILHEVNTIIIPGLGALTVTNKATGEIMFMSYLKHDDGNLARYISEKEGISENDARNLIAKYVREIQSKLDTGDTYDMYRFGRFIKKNGEIDFESWDSYQHPAEDEENADSAPEEKSTPETEAPAPVESPETDEQVKIPEPVEQHEVAETNEFIENMTEDSPPVYVAAGLDDILNKGYSVPVPDDTEKQEEPLDAIPEKEPSAEEITEPKLDVSEIKPEENVYIPKEEVKKIVAKQASLQSGSPKKAAAKAKAAESAADKTQPAQSPGKKKKSALFWVLVIVGIVVLAGGAATTIFYKQLFGKEEVKKNKESAMLSDENLEEIEKQVELEAEQDSALMAQEAATEKIAVEEAKKSEIKQIEEAVKQPVKQPVKTTFSGGGSYHIIAGGFGVEANAERLAKKYQAEGKDARVLGKFDDLYLVSYGSFATQGEANQALKNAGIKGWVFKYSK